MSLVMVKSKKEDFGKFMTSTLQNSMLTGVPQIATAGNWPKRIARTLVFFLCVTGFVYQSLSFMWLYWEYEVTVDVQVENPAFADRPSLTICTEVGFKSNMFCHDNTMEPLRDKLDIGCYKVEDNEHGNLCDCIPRLCEDDVVKNLTYVNELYGLASEPREDLKKFMVTHDKLLLFCYDVKMRKGVSVYCEGMDYYVEIPCQWHTSAVEYCFTMFSKIGRPNHTINEVPTFSEIELILAVNEDDYLLDTRAPTLAMSIHNQHTITNPFTDGFVVEADQVYTFHLKKVVKNLLPHPYKTDCVDYRSMWEARGGYGPTNMKECILECQRNLSMEKHGCILKDMYLVTDDRRCPSVLDDQDIYVEAQKCAQKNCKRACYEEYYVVEVDSIKMGIGDRCEENTYKKDRNLARVLLKLDGMETTIYTYSPKFQDIETFGYLGGYVGMWLGISLVAVFDFIETLIVMMKYPMRRYAIFKEKRRKVAAMQRFQRSL